MRLTISRALALAESGLSDTAFRIYVTAHARIAETGCEALTTVGLMSLPGMPRNAKALGRAITELINAGLVFAEGAGYTFPAPRSDVTAKRAAAGRLGGLAKASKRLASASGLPPPLLDGLPGDLPAGCQPDATEPSPSLVLSPSDSQALQSVVSSVSSEDSALLSSGSGPESKPARGRAKPRTAAPEQLEPTAAHEKIAAERGLELANEIARCLNHHRAKGNLMANWNAAVTTWLLGARPGPPGPRASGGGRNGGGSSMPMLLDRIQELEGKNASR